MRPFRMEWPAWPEMVEMARVPKVDIIDRDNEVLVRAEIPGVKKEDLDVSVTDDTVTIRGPPAPKRKMKRVSTTSANFTMVNSPAQSRCRLR